MNPLLEQALPLEGAEPDVVPPALQAAGHLHRVLGGVVYEVTMEFTLVGSHYLVAE